MKKKWKGLKDVFRKELKKINATKSLSSWSHFQDMEFMKDQMSPRELLPVPIETLFKTEMVEEGEEGDSNYTPGYILRNSLMGGDQLRENGDATSSDGETTQPDSNTRPRGTKRRFVDEEQYSTPTFSFTMPEDLHKDDDYNFLVSFLPYLKTMSPRKKLLYRMKLCQLLYETTYSNESN